MLYKMEQLHVIRSMARLDPSAPRRREPGTIALCRLRSGDRDQAKRGGYGRVESLCTIAAETHDDCSGPRMPLPQFIGRLTITIPSESRRRYWRSAATSPRAIPNGCAGIIANQCSHGAAAAVRVTAVSAHPLISCTDHKACDIARCIRRGLLIARLPVDRRRLRRVAKIGGWRERQVREFTSPTSRAGLRPVCCRRYLP